MRFEDRLPVTCSIVFGLDGGDVGHFADVRAGDERLVAGAGQDHAAHRGVVARVLEEPFAARARWPC